MKKCEVHTTRRDILHYDLVEIAYFKCYSLKLIIKKLLIKTSHNTIQNDIVMGTLSVRENLHFSAALSSTIAYDSHAVEGESGENYQ